MANSLAVLNQPDLDNTPDDSDYSFDLPKALRLYYKNGNSLAEIAEILNTPRSTVYYRLQAVLKMLPPRSEIDAYRDNKSSILDAAEYKLVCKMLDTDTIEKSTLNNAAYAFQQIATQNRLEKGLSTSNVSAIEIHASISDLQTQASKLRDQLKHAIQDVVSKTDNPKP